MCSKPQNEMPWKIRENDKSTNMFMADNIEFFQDYHSGGMFLLSQLNAVDVFLLVSGFLLYRFSADPMRRLGFPYVGIYLAFRIVKWVPVSTYNVKYIRNKSWFYLRENPKLKWPTTSLFKFTLSQKVVFNGRKKEKNENSRQFCLM